MKLFPARESLVSERPKMGKSVTFFLQCSAMSFLAFSYEEATFSYGRSKFFWVVDVGGDIVYSWQLRVNNINWGRFSFILS
jgi:hypothetical protein